MKDTAGSLVGLVVTIAVSTVAGAIGSVVYMKRQEPPQRFVVVDMRPLIEPIVSDASLDAAARREKTKRVADAITQSVNALAEQGVIVLDASAVLRAPKETYVKP